MDVSPFWSYRQCVVDRQWFGRPARFGENEFSEHLVPIQLRGRCLRMERGKADTSHTLRGDQGTGTAPEVGVGELVVTRGHPMVKKVWVCVLTPCFGQQQQQQPRGWGGPGR